MVIIKNKTSIFLNKNGAKNLNKENFFFTKPKQKENTKSNQCNERTRHLKMWKHQKNSTNNRELPFLLQQEDTIKRIDNIFNFVNEIHVADWHH